MALTDERFERTEVAVREAGLAALIQSLGYADAVRFVTQLGEGRGDYLKWQEQVFGDANVDEIYEQAQKHWEKRAS
ncbi:MAG: hypothetical protein ISS56_20440 [Anaerolineae bacterium]|nr:hypothetical protein [Anaerolineae bacterium]